MGETLAAAEARKSRSSQLVTTLLAHFSRKDRVMASDSDIGPKSGRFRSCILCHGGGDQPGLAGMARLARRSASIASKVIHIGRSPLSHAHRAAVSPP